MENMNWIIAMKQNDDENHQLYLDSGFDDVINKPMQLQIQKILDKRLAQLETY